jgi:hypothetical protein
LTAFFASSASRSRLGDRIVDPKTSVSRWCR